jgi:hypothetical protein
MHLELLHLGWFCHLIFSVFLLQVETSEKDHHHSLIASWHSVVSCCNSSYTGSSANQAVSRAVSSTLQQSLYRAAGIIDLRLGSAKPAVLFPFRCISTEHAECKKPGLYHLVKGNANFAQQQEQFGV